MIVRVLYLLLRQRLEQWRSGPEAPATAPSLRSHGREADKATAKYPRRWPYWIMLAVGVGALAYVWYQASRSGLEVPTDSASAELILQIQGSSNWPLAVYLTGDGLPPPQQQAFAPERGRIEIINARFAPAFQVLPSAAKIEIVNSDPISHNTHVFNRGETIFNVGLPTKGITVRKTLTGSGIFSVRCDLHPSMQAWLLVPPSAHYAVVNEPQTVVFSSLAPGEYVLHLWQADGSERPRLVKLTSGETKKLHLR